MQESHPQTGIDLTYIAQSGDTSAPPSYAATGGDRYVGLDQFGRVDDQLYVNPSSVTSPTDRFQYSFDSNSNLLYKNVVEQGTTAATFSQLYHASGGFDSGAYDGQNRLTTFEQGTLSNTNSGNGSVLDTVASPTATQLLSLDSLGNWDGSSVTGGGTTVARTFNAQNQITNNSGSTTPTYDNDGNVTEDDAGTTYTYTPWNQIATTSAGGGLYFGYLPNGPQASVSTSPCGGTTSYNFYSTQWQDIEDVPSTGNPSTYVWGLENVNELVARDDGSGTRLYAQHDANMDVTALVNTSGTVEERFSYSPSGVVTVLSPSWASTTDAYSWTFLWQGGKYNGSDGLYTFGYRDYSPTLGTWMEEDPTGYAAGPNVYQAMLGAPIEKTDPYGLQAAPQPGASSSAASGSSGGSPSTSPAPPDQPQEPGVSVTHPEDVNPPPPPSSEPFGTPWPQVPPSIVVIQIPPSAPLPGGDGLFPGGIFGDPKDKPPLPPADPMDLGPALQMVGDDFVQNGTQLLQQADKDHSTGSTPQRGPNPLIIRIRVGGGDWQFVYDPTKPLQLVTEGLIGDTKVTVTVKHGAPTGAQGNSPSPYDPLLRPRQ